MVENVLELGPGILGEALKNRDDIQKTQGVESEPNEYRFLEAEVRLWMLQVAFRGGADSAIVSDRLESAAVSIGATERLSPKFDSLGFEVYGEKEHQVIEHHKKWHLIYNSTGIRINEQESEQVARLRRHAFWISTLHVQHRGHRKTIKNTSVMNRFSQTRNNSCVPLGVHTDSATRLGVLIPRTLIM